MFRSLVNGPVIQRAWSLHAAVLLTLFMCVDSRSLVAQKGPLGVFEGQSNIGYVTQPGSAEYDPAKQVYTIRASGDNMWMKKDAFYFVWKKLSGDVAISASIRFPHEGHNPHRKAVLLLRQNLGATAVYGDAALHGSGLTALQYRPAEGDVTGDIELNFASISDAPTELRIEKRGDQMSMSIGGHGQPLHLSGAATRVLLDGSFYAGLGVCSHDKDVTEEAVFSNVKIETLPPVALNKPDLRSTLQTISVGADARRATEIYTAQGHFEAPNWTRDGKSLIFDQGGKMMIVSADGGEPHPVDLGAAMQCNGSHGLSPDGKLLAVSCNPQGGPGSRVYIVPTGGGQAHVVTETPSSYFHSWSPDGKTIAFARPHPGGGDIFSISVDGGKETRLTTTETISDDPDYSPDGQYIYFNSDRGGGTMQIWRMHADGSHAEQITSDERNNWTPHVSPDGKLMVYLSYDHAVTGHPTNKEISLRILSLEDKSTRTLVDLTGGSGTINVPSWAPDSKSLAFVSYELVP